MSNVVINEKNFDKVKDFIEKNILKGDTFIDYNTVIVSNYTEINIPKSTEQLEERLNLGIFYKCKPCDEDFDPDDVAILTHIYNLHPEVLQEPDTNGKNATKKPL